MKEYKNGERVKVNKNNEDIIKYCINCARPTKECSVRDNLDAVFIIKINYQNYILLHKDKKSGCRFLPKHLLPAMKWIRMK